MSKRTEIVNIARSQIGNGCTKYCNWWGYHTEWCAIFVSWCANEAGVLNTAIPKQASCTSMLNWFASQGRRKERGYVPQPGDIIFLKWASDTLPGPSHVGIVESCDGTTIHTIEGNTSGDVCARSAYSVNYNSGGNCIYGFGVPDYGNGSGSSGSHSDSPYTNSRGQCGPNPQLLWNTSYDADVADLQQLLNSIRGLNSPVDGIAGPRIYAMLKDNYRIYDNDYGPVTKWVQQRLRTMGLYTGYVDGQAGPLTRQAIFAFQARYGLGQGDLYGTDWYYMLVK